MEFLTKYEKIADKNIAGFGEIIKVAAHVVEDRAFDSWGLAALAGTPLYAVEPTETPDVEGVDQFLILRITCCNSKRYFPNKCDLCWWQPQTMTWGQTPLPR